MVVKVMFGPGDKTVAILIYARHVIKTIKKSQLHEKNQECFSSVLFPSLSGLGLSLFAKIKLEHFFNINNFATANWSFFKHCFYFFLPSTLKLLLHHNFSIAGLTKDDLILSCEWRELMLLRSVACLLYTHIN